MILKKHWGGIDIAINNAGVIKDKALALMTPDDWHDVMNTKFRRDIQSYQKLYYNIHKTEEAVLL